MEPRLATLFDSSPPLNSDKTASHPEQMTLCKSLAGGGVPNDSPLVPKGRDVLNSLLRGQANVR